MLQKMLVCYPEYYRCAKMLLVGEQLTISVVINSATDHFLYFRCIWDNTETGDAGITMLASTSVFF